MDSSTNNKRKYQRFYGKGTLPGKLLLEENNHQVIQHSEVINVSQRGIGILTEQPLSKGTRLILKIEGRPPVNLEIVFCYQELGHSKLIYNVGLFARSENISITKLLASYGIVINEKIGEAG